MGGNQQPGIREENDQFKGWGNGLDWKEKREVAGIGDCFDFIKTTAREQTSRHYEGALPPALGSPCLRVLCHCPNAVPVANSTTADVAASYARTS